MASNTFMATILFMVVAIFVLMLAQAYMLWGLTEFFGVFTPVESSSATDAETIKCLEEHGINAGC